MKRFVHAILFCVVALWIVPVQAQTTDLEVGKLPQLKVKWGRQPVNVTVKNNVDYPKFVVGLTKLSFTGTYLNPNRQWKVNRIVQPSESIELPLSLDIPSNFGTANIVFEIYSVVDTLDQISLGEKIFSQNFSLNFKVPDEVSGYLQDKISFPPMAGNSPVFDNEFNRIIILMLAEGKSIDEIKKIPGIDTTVVTEFLTVLEIKKYVTKNEQGYTLTFPFLTKGRLEILRPLVESASNDMIGILEKNLKNYRLVLDSLIKVGLAPKDSNDFLNGGSILYERYPFISTMLLWNMLGQKFVTDTLPLEIYKRTDLCNCAIQPFMYGIQGGDYFSGHHFFARFSQGKGIYIRFGDVVPKVKCPDFYPFLPILSQGTHWDFEKDFKQEIFLLSSQATRPMLDMMAQGTEPVIEKTKAELKQTLETMGPNMFTQGTRLWFWDVVASRTLDKLVASGSLTRKGNGQYMMNVVDK